MKWLAALAMSVALLPAQAGSEPALSVTAVRHWSFTDATRVAVQVSGDFSFRTARLHNPERVYFDILDSRPFVNSRPGYTEVVDDPLVQRIRIAVYQPDVTRVVLDVAERTEVSASRLVNPSRLLIEVRAAALTAAPPPSAPKAGPQAAIPPPVRPAPAEGTMAGPGRAPAPARERGPDARPAKPAAVEPPADPAETARAARRTSAGGSSLVRALGLKIARVVIDPGHGGHDQGTEGPHGLLEKDLVLDVAQRLGALIEERMGSEVIYTRSDDTFVPLHARTELANEKKADLFLSIHANSSPVAPVAGIETFYLSVTGGRYSMDVAARENAGSQQSVFELSDLVQQIARTDKAAESREFAARIQSALFALSARYIPAAKDRGVKSAPFLVLIGARMPSVLAEIGFLSNPREESLLRKSDYRQKLADALYRGVSRYADSLSHFQPAPAPSAAAAAKTVAAKTR